MKPWCANCRIELPAESSTTEFISHHDGYEVKISIAEAILTVFEFGLKLNHAKIQTSQPIKMCSQCTALLAELYRLYVEFMKLSRETSKMQTLLRSSILWNFGGDVEGGEAYTERDSKRFFTQERREGDGDFESISSMSMAPEIIPKIQIHADDGDEGEGEGGFVYAHCQTIENENVENETPPDDGVTPVPGSGRRRTWPKFPCKTCGKEFTRRSDTQRHIRTVHGASEGGEGSSKGQPKVKKDPNLGNTVTVNVEEEFIEEVDDEDRFLRESRKYASEGIEADGDRDPEDTDNAKFQSQVFKSFKCDQCDKTFRRKDYLKAHERSHMSPEERKKELQQRRAIERLHSRSRARKPRKQVGKKRAKGTAGGTRKTRFTYRCSECDQCFPTRETMKYHRRKVHPKNSFPCSGCDRIFHSENELKIHENVKHGVGEKLPDRICPVPGCGKYFALPNIMKRHVQSVHCEEKDRTFECPFCPLKFPIKNRLDTHLKNRHNSDNSLQSLKCEHCHRVYETKSGLTQHIETVHTNLTIYSCDICGRTSIRPEWLRKHMELHDSNREKKFACTMCEMKFYRMASLKKHMKNHSGAKNYLCSECGDKFRQTSSLRRHIEAKHSDKNGPFVCNQCGKSFKIKEYLAQHLRAKSHGGRGHGLYTPAGRRRLERERQQQQQQQQGEEDQDVDEAQEVDVEVSSATQPRQYSQSSLIDIGDDGENVGTHGASASLLELKNDDHQTMVTPMSVFSNHSSVSMAQPLQQQPLIISEGARLVLIDGQHHLIQTVIPTSHAHGSQQQPVSVSLAGVAGGANPQHVNVLELVITNTGPQLSQVGQPEIQVRPTATGALQGRLTRPPVPSSYSSTQQSQLQALQGAATATAPTINLPPAPAQIAQTPIQFLTTVNPAWFQTHSISEISQHVASAAASSTIGSAVTTAAVPVTAISSHSNSGGNAGESSSNSTSQFF